MILEKKCSGKNGCQIIKPVSEFHKSKSVKDGYSRNCRSCLNKDQTRARSCTLKRKFGLTLEDYQLLFHKQDGKCAICRKPEQSNKKYLCIDHIHGTNPKQIRGLLCHKCNVSIGLADDSIYRLKQMISYLTVNQPKIL